MCVCINNLQLRNLSEKCQANQTVRTESTKAETILKSIGKEKCDKKCNAKMVKNLKKILGIYIGI